MTFSTRANPRIGQTGTSLTGLGAVGGPRGAAAGALRVFVEFLTQYDKKAIGELEGDIAKLEHAQQVSEAAETKRLREITRLQNNLNEARRIEGLLSREQRADLKELVALQGTRSKGAQKAAEVEEERLKTILLGTKFGDEHVKLTAEQVDNLLHQEKIRSKIAVLQDRQSIAEKGQAERIKQITTSEGIRNKILTARTQLVPRLAGLLTGVAGGLFGGALLGAGFFAFQQVFDTIGEKILDLVDPARHAREAILEIGKAINSLADQQKIGTLEAARQFVAGFGVTGPAAEHLVGAAATAASQQKILDLLKQESELLDILNNKKALEAELRKKISEVLVEEAKAEGNYQKQVEYETRGLKGTGLQPVITEFIGNQELANAVEERFNQLLKDTTNEALKAAQADRELAAAALRVAYADQMAADAAAALIGQHQAQTQTQIEALGTGESARTKALQAAIEAAQNAGGGSSLSSTLRNIEEQRAIILLRQRLRLLGANIDLEKYSGKFLLEAINAKIVALQKEGDEQNRLNQLLDLQYRESQTLRRQEGESISAFIERRAQQNREFLAEHADLERQAQIDQLQAQQERVQDEVALADLAEQKKEALHQQGTSNYIKELQKQLKASQEADAKILKAKQEALQAEQKAFEDAANTAVKTASDAEQSKFRAALAGVKKIEDLYKLSGAIQGALGAKAFFQAFGSALLATGLLSKSEYDTIMKRLNYSISAYLREKANFSSNAIRDLGNFGPGLNRLASGGIINLTNARSPFGQNVQLGEQGQEIGVILSNKVADILKRQTGSPEQVGPFYINRSDDPLRDKYLLKRTVKEAIAEALR